MIHDTLIKWAYKFILILIAVDMNIELLFKQEKHWRRPKSHSSLAATRDAIL